MMLGVVLVTLCIALIALVSGWRVRSTGEFTVAGRRAGWTVVSGIIVGALVGGSRLRGVGNPVRNALAAHERGNPAAIPGLYLRQPDPAIGGGFRQYRDF